MPPEQLMAWVVALNTLITLGSSLYTFVTARATKALQATEKLSKQLEDAAEKRKVEDAALVARIHITEARVSKLETDLTHLPDRTQTHRLEMAVERLGGQIEVLEERLKPVAAIGDRLLEWTIEQARK